MRAISEFSFDELVLWRGELRAHISRQEKRRRFLSVAEVRELSESRALFRRITKEIARRATQLSLF